MKTLIHYLSYLLKYKITVNLSCANFVVNSPNICWIYWSLCTQESIKCFWWPLEGDWCINKYITTRVHFIHMQKSSDKNKPKNGTKIFALLRRRVRTVTECFLCHVYAAFFLWYHWEEQENWWYNYIKEMKISLNLPPI